ncbi:IS3 family transposase [Marinimicrobium alkaliphilum]|uniref:IS3 family transposase n=1 Tax=Marinimicrobium alkaliphilum TaxID=2202654 RepID=UPI0038CC14CF
MLWKSKSLSGAPKDRVTCSRRRVARIMRENGIRATVVGLYHRNPKRHNHYRRVSNVLATAPKPTRLNEQWVADFTYLKTKKDSWVYLSTIMDAYSRKVVGWSISKTRDSTFTCTSLAKAVRSRKPRSGGIFHTDQGIEYAASEFQSAVKKATFVPSMSGRGRCLDNAMAESLFHTFKTESYYQRRFLDIGDIRKEFVDYVDFYNNERLHSSLDYLSPKEFEERLS